MTFCIIKSSLLHEPDGIFFWWQYLMDYCINPFFPVVLVLWHNHLTLFVGLTLLCWKMACCCICACKFSPFFSNNNGFMQKSAKSLLISYFLCTFAPDNEPLKQAGGSESSGLTIRISWQNTEIRIYDKDLVPVIFSSLTAFAICSNADLYWFIFWMSIFHYYSQYYSFYLQKYEIILKEKCFCSFFFHYSLGSVTLGVLDAF